MSDGLFRFGPFELDPGRRELRREGDPVDMQPRVFDLLLYLVRHRDRAVDKDELQDALWGGVIVTEASLARAVMKARKAIGDDATAQSWIRTVHGHGYHFVGSVEVEAGSPPPAAPGPGMPAGIEHACVRTPARWPIIALPLLALLAMLALWWLFVPRESAGDLRVAVLPVHDTSGDPERAWTRLGLMSLVSTELARDGDMAVVEDGSVAGLAANLAWDGEPDSESGLALLERLQRVYGATHVLAIELVPEGPMLRLNHSLIGTEGREQRGTMVGTEPVALAMGAVQAVYGELLGRSRPGKDVPLVSEDPFNNEAFARGMDLSLEGRCAEAVQFFRVIVEQEPGLFAPRLELASCLRILGQAEEAEALLTDLADEQRALDHPAPLGQALLALGVVYNRSGRLDEAERSYQAALDAAEAAGDGDLTARVLHNQAILAKNRGQWAASAELLDRATLEYQRAGREVMPGQLWSGYANLKMETGELAAADDYLEQALTAFRAIGDRRNEALILNNYGFLRRLQGRLEEAAAYIHQSMAIREEIRDRVGVGHNFQMLANLAESGHEHSAARDYARQALEVARETSDNLLEGTSLATMAGAEMALGETEQARAHYVEARRVLQSGQDSMRVLQVDLRLGWLDLKTGDPAQAAVTAEAIIASASAQGHLKPEIEAQMLLGDAHEELAAHERAVEDYREALELVRGSEFSDLETQVLVRLSDLLLDLGRREDAAPLVGALTRLEPSAGSLKARARFAFVNGDVADAARFMAEARELAGEEWDAQDQAALDRYTEQP